MSSLHKRLNLLGCDQHALEQLFIDLGEKPFRSKQLMQWIHQYGVIDFNAMTNLGKTLRQRLGEIAEIRPPEIASEQHSQDGTIKWLLRLDDGNCIEMVYIPEEERGTLCISSQVGCPLKCSFCSTGMQGFNRNLEVGEIVGQLWLARQELTRQVYAGQIPNRKMLNSQIIKTQASDNGNSRPDSVPDISNVVLMGMGEPLLNLDNVVKALSLMTDDLAYGLARRKITLSTAGVIPAMDRLRELVDVSLAVSLHAPVDELRDELVPLNKKYPLDQLMNACRRYIKGKSRSKITFEYAMLAGINDSPDHARALVKLLRGVPAKINLIPFNPFPGADYQRSDISAINSFRNILMHNGLVTVTRKTRGDDIAAACGQLTGEFSTRKRKIPVVSNAQKMAI